MFYLRSLEIEQRLQTVLELVGKGEYSTPMIAEKLGVSTPTVSCDMTALRDRGYDIRSKRRSVGWRYYLAIPCTQNGHVGKNDSARVAH